MEVTVKTSIVIPEYHALAFVRSVLTPVGTNFQVNKDTRTIKSDYWEMQCEEIDSKHSIAIWKVAINDTVAPLVLLGLLKWASVDFS